MIWLITTAIFLSLLQNVDSRCDCTEKIILLLDDDDTFRLVKSPDYPRNYCPGMNCTWRVVSSTNRTANSKLYFYADNIDLREGKDFIEFYDQQFLSIPENATHRCTGSGSCQYSTESKIMTIRFLAGGGDIDNVGFQGIVSAYDKKFKDTIQTLCKYLGIPAIVAAIATVVLLGYCCYKKRKNHEYTQAPNSDKSHPDRLTQ